MRLLPESTVVFPTPTGGTPGRTISAEGPRSFDIVSDGMGFGVICLSAQDRTTASRDTFKFHYEPMSTSTGTEPTVWPSACEYQYLLSGT